MSVGVFVAMASIVGAGCGTTTTSSSSKTKVPATGPGSQYEKIVSQAKSFGAGPAANIVPVHGFVAGGRSVLHLKRATVEISNGKSPIGKSRTGRFGVAIVPLNQPPKKIVVSVSGGQVNGKSFTGVLRAELTDYVAPKTVCVNALTTMVADDQLTHPAITLAVATSRVKRLFDLPSWYDIGCDSQSNGYFDGDAVYKDIQKVGFQKFIDKAIVLMNDPHQLSTDGFRLLPVADTSSPTTRKLSKATTTSQTRSPDSASTSAALTAFLTDSTSQSPLSGISQVFSSLSTISDASSLAFLAPFGIWGGVGLGVYSVVSAFAGGSSGPTTGDLLSSLQTDFTALQSAITNVQGTLNGIESQISNLSTQSYGADLANAETIVNPLVTSAQSNMTSLQVLNAEALEITCGDFSSSGPTGNCNYGETLPNICPAQTILTWNAATGQVAFPNNYETVLPQDATALESNCQSYYTDVFGEGGFVATMDGNSALGGDASAELTTNSLTVLASDLVDLQGGTSAIVQDTSQWVVSQSRFLDTQESAQVQSVFDYYLSAFDEMALDIVAYDGITGESATNVHTNFDNVPTLADINTYDPTTVPEGEVVDTQTGLIWSQLISANVQCQNLIASDGSAYCNGGNSPLGFFGTPSSITPTALTPASGSRLPTLYQGAPVTQNLNADGNAVALVNPLSVSSTDSNASPETDWYAADVAQLSSLVTNLSPTGSQTIGDELQQEPEMQNGGAGFDPVIFGGDNQNTGPTIGGGIFDPTQYNQYENPNSNGFCFTEMGCFYATVAPSINQCSLASNVNCAAPAYVENSRGFWDLNNGTPSSEVGAFVDTVGAINWDQDASFCTDVDGWTTSCYSGDTVSFNNVEGAISNTGGFVTWFYRSPVASTTGPSECYFYPPVGATFQSGSYAAPGATQGVAACGTTPNPNGYNGFWSQAVIPTSEASTPPAS